MHVLFANLTRIVLWLDQMTCYAQGSLIQQRTDTHFKVVSFFIEVNFAEIRAFAMIFACCFIS